MGNTNSRSWTGTGTGAPLVAIPELAQMNEGMKAIKIGRDFKSHERFFVVSSDGSSFSWGSRNKSTPEATVFLRRVGRIETGIKSEIFLKAKDKYAEDQCFTLYLPERTLDVVCPTREMCRLWVSGLTALVKSAQEDLLMDFMKTEWGRADADGSGSLEFAELVKLMFKMNINIKTVHLYDNFKKVDTDGSGTLDFAEFSEFIRNLRRQTAVDEIFNSFAGSKGFMDATDVLRFLHEVQKQTKMNLDDARALITRFARSAAEGKLSINAFTDYMGDHASDVMDARAAVVYQDMSQPLSHYFINSSHNTYLEGDQLKSNSSVNAYIRALVNGCRCVELDCWDGPDGDPIIYHGHTLTSRIKFRDVIQTIKDHGFTASPFPVILSLEVHCSLPQQTKMAEIMKEILGSMLPPTYVADWNMKTLPSPEQLRYKVLIKASTQSVAPPGSTAPPEEEEPDNDEESVVPEGDAAAAASPVLERKASSPATIEKAASKKAVKVSVAKELHDMVHLKTKHFKDFKTPGPCWEMSSFSEGKADSLCTKQAADFVQYNKTQLARIYPSGIRVDSSNYDPVRSWMSGCQIVALNFQTSDSPMWNNVGLFRDNGGSGYILKPAGMRDAAAKFDPVAPGPARSRVTIEVISARQLPKVGDEKSEVIDPYVVVEMFGVPTDCAKYRTKTIDDNGFNPVWKESFSFTVHEPELAFVRFVVYDEDPGRDDFVGYRVVPIRLLQAGVRSVALYDGKHRHIEFCSLLVKVTVE